MKKVILLSVLLGMLPLMLGCETSRGLGEDIEDAGEEVGDAVDDAVD